MSWRWKLGLAILFGLLAEAASLWRLGFGRGLVVGPGVFGLGWALMLAWAGWRTISFPWRTRKTLRYLWGENREKQPKLRLVWRGWHCWRLGWKMPPGAESARWQENADAIAEDLNCSASIWYENGLVWMRLGVRRLPRKGSRKAGYSRFYKRPRPRGELVFGVGYSQEGRLYADLAKLPHLLIGGQTNSGKSRFLAQLIICLAESYPPEELRMLLIDLKGKGAPEFRRYAALPHLDRPVVGDMDSCREALMALELEMDERYQQIVRADCLDLEEYNARHPERPMPRKLVVVDEAADLVQSLTSPELKAFERLIRELRACGVHIVLATQRPDANVVPGQIRNNMGAVLAFKTGNRTSSEVLLGDGHSAAVSIPPGQPGLGVWQREAEVRVRTVYLTPQEAEARVAALSGRWSSGAATLPSRTVEGEAQQQPQPLASPSVPGLEVVR